jgi:hypothetical protein
MPIQNTLWVVYMDDELIERSVSSYQECIELINDLRQEFSAQKYQILKYTLAPIDIEATPFYSPEYGVK